MVLLKLFIWLILSYSNLKKDIVMLINDKFTVGLTVKMKNIDEHKRLYRVYDTSAYTTFTVAVGTIGVINAVHLHFCEVDWENYPKVTQFNNPVIHQSKGWITAKEYLETAILSIK
jgi:hypothetical protein